MTVSMRVMSAGDGYRYLLKTVAVADGVRPLLSMPLTRYYLEEGTPPGRWLGAGVGELRVGDRVSEAQLQLLMGAGVTRSPVVHWAALFRCTRARRSVSMPGSLLSTRPCHQGVKGEVVAQIVAEDTAWGTRRAVPGSTSRSRFPSPHPCCGRSRMRGCRH